MPARSPNAAVADFAGRLRRVTACVTDRPLLATGWRPSSRPNFVSFAPVDDPARLRTSRGESDTALRARIEYVVDRNEGTTEGFEVRIVDYRYTVLDRDGREVLAYHWHPVGVSPVTFPHQHLSSRLGPLDLGRGARTVALGEMHLPTGFVTLADVVQLLITEFDVAPRRADWETILQNAHDGPMTGSTVETQ